MATLGICSYCSRPAARTCGMCGKAICEQHADTDNRNVCASCAQGSVIS